MNTSTIKASFNGIVGQVEAVAHFVKLLLCFLAGKPVPASLLVGQAGAGKSTFMRAIRHCVEAAGVQCFFFESPLELREKDAFADFIAVARLHDNKPMVIILDELHRAWEKSLPEAKTVQIGKLKAFLMQATLLSQQGRSNLIKIDENHSLFFNHEKHWIIGGTNYAEKIEASALSRFEKSQLGEFNKTELGKILCNQLDARGIRYTPDTVKPLVNVCRTSARMVDELTGRLATQIQSQNKNSINKADVITVLRESGLYPHGFSKDGVRMLESLAVPRKVAVLAVAFPNLSAKDIRHALAHANTPDCGFVMEAGSAWKLTPKGLRALSDWKKAGFRW